MSSRAPDDPLAGDGIQLALDPVLGPEGDPVGYAVYLINATGHRVITDVTARAAGARLWNRAGALNLYEHRKIGLVEYGHLSEKLQFAVDVRVLRVDGTGPRHFRNLTIKPKRFFDHLEEVAELQRPAHLYTIFTDLDDRAVAQRSAEPAPSLRRLTAEQQRTRARPAKSTEARPVTTDPAGRAEFPAELDLHLAALVKNPSVVPRHQVLSTQLRFFDEYIDRALRLGVDRVFIIHGVGNGVLKREVHQRLRYVQFVKKYKNEYHPKYGYGATEVIFS